jgi:hypothetical protein
VTEPGGWWATRRYDGGIIALLPATPWQPRHARRCVARCGGCTRDRAGCNCRNTLISSNAWHTLHRSKKQPHEVAMLYLVYMIVSYRNIVRARAEAANDTDYRQAA